RRSSSAATRTWAAPPRAAARRRGRKWEPMRAQAGRPGRAGAAAGRRWEAAQAPAPPPAQRAAPTRRAAARPGEREREGRPPAPGWAVPLQPAAVHLWVPAPVWGGMLPPEGEVASPRLGRGGAPSRPDAWPRSPAGGARPRGTVRRDNRDTRRLRGPSPRPHT